MTDLLLAIAHHLLVFSLAAILAVELATIRPGLGGASLRRLGIVDLHYGLIAALILIVGFARVYMGVKGPEAYLGAWTFWAKVGAFALVGLLLMAVAFCFAEAAGMFDASGGPYLYTRKAFGTPVGFAVGWIGLSQTALAYGAVVVLLAGLAAVLRLRSED